MKGGKSREPLRTVHVGSVPELDRLPPQLRYRPTPWKLEAERVFRLNKHNYILLKCSANYCNLFHAELGCS